MCGGRGEKLREQPARDNIGQNMKALQIGDRGPAKIKEIEEIEGARVAPRNSIKAN